jgi:hypothetical protein
VPPPPKGIATEPGLLSIAHSRKYARSPLRGRQDPASDRSNSAGGSGTRPLASSRPIWLATSSNSAGPAVANGACALAPGPHGTNKPKSITRSTDRETMNRRRAHLLWFWSGCHYGGPECPLGGGRGSRLPELPGHGDDPGTDPGRVLHVVRPTTG